MRSATQWLAAVGLIAAFVFTAAQAQPSCGKDAPAGCGIPSAARKLHAGHYLMPYLGDSRAALLSRVEEVCREPALQGLELRVQWARLESAPGRFDFGDVERIYRELASCEKRLVLEVWAVTFRRNPSGVVPKDLEDYLAPTRQGYIAQLWNPAVMDRFIALYEALGRRFDDEPYFEAIVFTETATGGAREGYTPERYIAELERALKKIRAAWPSTNVLVYNNFLSKATDRQAVEFFRTLHEIGVGFGGPDVFPPPHNSTRGERIYRGELGGVDYRGKMLSGFSVQTPELGGREGTFTPHEVFDHCVRTNRCQYMFWVRNTSQGGPEQRWSTGILPFIREHPTLAERPVR